MLAAQLAEKLQGEESNFLSRLTEVPMGTDREPVILLLPPDKDRWILFGNDLQGLPLDFEIAFNLREDYPGVVLRGGREMSPYHMAMKWTGSEVQIKPAKNARVEVCNSDGVCIESYRGDGTHEDRHSHAVPVFPGVMIVRMGQVPVRLFRESGTDNLRAAMNVTPDA